MLKHTIFFTILFGGLHFFYQSTCRVFYRPFQSVAQKAPYALIGIPSFYESIEERTQVRQIGWIGEYPKSNNVQYQFILGAIDNKGKIMNPAIIQREISLHNDICVVNAREAMKNPVDHKYHPGEKVIAWLRVSIFTFSKTRFFVKADIDTWINLPKLENNLLFHRNIRSLGNTLWASYSISNFEGCGYGSGLNMAQNMQKQCLMMKGVDSMNDVIGPFPFHVGAMWILRQDLAFELLSNTFVYDFSANASIRFSPPFWVKGEDIAFGLFTHLTNPEENSTHWGWNVIHDVLCDKASFVEKNISTSTLALHNVQRCRKDWSFVREEFRKHKNSAVERIEWSKSPCESSNCDVENIHILPRFECDLNRWKYPTELYSNNKNTNVTCRKIKL